MKAVFHTEYFTDGGATLRILFDDGMTVDMRPCAAGEWLGGRDVADGVMKYHYCVCSGDTVVRTEPCGAHSVEGCRNVGRADIYDAWYEPSDDSPFLTSMFTDAVFRRDDDAEPLSVACANILLEVEAPTLRRDEMLAVAGDAEELGRWDVAHSVIMNDAAAPVWRVLLPTRTAGAEYKFVIRDRKSGALRCWEEGGNRRLPAASGGDAAVVRGLRLRDGRRRWHGAGVAVPLFSLRSGKDWGVGEFRDIGVLAEWAAAAGMSVIQLLPVNDTSVTGTWRDSYPYNPLSCFALHPLYVCGEDAVAACRAFCSAEEAEALQGILDGCLRRGAVLNALPEVDYESVMALKHDLLRGIYDVCGERMVASDDCRRFVSENNGWLVPYAVFCSLRSEYGDERAKWGALERYDAAEAEKYAASHRQSVDYHIFVQYILDAQMRAARQAAHACGVALKGDIPIGVAPSGVDVWRNPELFNVTMSAGAPPDAFAAEGQNWGFPTYDWPRMASEGYEWWRRRLQKMGEYFDAYRLDHILGFFRIWEIPRTAVSALLGHFNPQLPLSKSEIEEYGFHFVPSRDAARDLGSRDVLFLAAEGREESYFPRIGGYDTAAFLALDETDREAYRRLHDDYYYHRHDSFWRENAMGKLPVLIGASRMLACGEDLGMIPACVPEVMARERILSLEIERMPKQAGVAFADPSRYPYLSVAATSTHDMPTVRGWWQGEREAARLYYHEVLHCEGEAPQDCTPDIARRIVERHMLSSSMLAILPLQDWLAADGRLRRADAAAERINVPAIEHYYWRYRVHITLEQLLAEKEFTASVRKIAALRGKA